MNYASIVMFTVVALSTVLGTWGASLVVRALASRTSRIALRLARGIPRRLNTAPPTLSRLQFWFGMIAGPISCVASAVLLLFALGIQRTDSQVAISWSMILALVLAMLTPGCFLVGFRWDAAKGRRRCPKCWYDYTGLGDEAPCPECGHAPRSARALARTRRNRLLMAISPVALVFAWIAFITPQVLRIGWRASIPNAVLIAGFEHCPDSMLFNRTAGDDGTLASRLWHGHMSVREVQWLERRSLRLVEKSQDPRTCALAATFLSYPSRYAGTSDVTQEERDKANANMLKVAIRAMKGPAPSARYASAMLGQTYMANGPLTRRVVREQLDEILSLYAASTTPIDQLAMGRLISGFAPVTPEVADAARRVAMDPKLSTDMHDAACAALGVLAARDPALRAALQAEFDAASGFARASLGTALVVSRIDPALAERRATWGALGVDPPECTHIFIDGMREPDMDLRNGAIAGIRGAARMLPVGLDWEALKQPLRDVAMAEPTSRMQAIQTTWWTGGFDHQIVPALVVSARDGDAAELQALANACQQAPIEERWRPLLDAVRERVDEPNLDPAAATALTLLKGRLESMLRP